MKTQFTLRQLFVCVACFCVGFATLATDARLKPSGLIAFCIPFFAATMIGTGVGYLFGNFKTQVFIGTIMAIVVLIIWIMLGGIRWGGP
jgi:hypothetical protein